MGSTFGDASEMACRNGIAGAACCKIRIADREMDSILFAHYGPMAPAAHVLTNFICDSTTTIPDSCLNAD